MGGFNAVNVGVIIFNCRHVKSRTNYIQRTGRMLRNAEGKMNSLLLDIGGASNDTDTFLVFTEEERGRGYGNVNFFPQYIQVKIETVPHNNYSSKKNDSDGNYNSSEEEEDSSEEEEDIEDSNINTAENNDNMDYFLKLLNDDEDDDGDDLDIEGGKVPPQV